MQFVSYTVALGLVTIGHRLDVSNCYGAFFMESRLISTVEAARVLGLTPAKVRELIAGGRLRAVNVSFGKRPTWFLSNDALESFLSGTAKPQPKDNEPTARRKRLDDGCKRWV